MHGEEVEKWGKRRGACRDRRRDMAASGGIKMSPVNGVCTCPKGSYGIEGCVGLLERNVSVQAGETGSGFVGEPAWNGLRCPSVLAQVPGTSVLRLTFACMGLVR